MKIFDALPNRKVKIIIYAPDAGKYIQIFKGSSDDNDKIFGAEYDHVAPSQEAYRFYLSE